MLDVWHCWSGYVTLDALDYMIDFDLMVSYMGHAFARSYFLEGEMGFLMSIFLDECYNGRFLSEIKAS